MKLVVFGLTVSSSWGNGHATLWRALCRELARRGHRVTFFERDVPYYAEHRDLREVRGVELVLYRDWEREARPAAEAALLGADAAVVTSFCPDGVAAADLVREAAIPTRAFYDLDTPVTLERLRSGVPVDYIGPDGLRGFDLVLSYTGGRALEDLRVLLGAERTAPLYGSVDPEAHHPAPPASRFEADLSYLGTYAADRQPALAALLLEPAARRPELEFIIGGALYPPDFPWAQNIKFVPHVPPADHPAFYGSSRLTLSVTRRAMAQNGYCPSGRLFEAAACGAVILTDPWPGLEEFFTPGAELLVCRRPEDVLAALDAAPRALSEVARAGRARALADHTAARRAEQLLELLEAARSR